MLSAAKEEEAYLDSEMTVCYRCGHSYHSGWEQCPSCGNSRNAKGGAKAALRWVAVLPAALLASGLAGVALEFAAYLTPQYAGGALGELWRSGLMGGFFVFAGSSVAPKKHPAVPFTLASLYCAALVLAIYYVSTSSSLAWDGGQTWAIVNIVVAIAAAFGTAAYEAFHD